MEKYARVKRGILFAAFMDLNKLFIQSQKSNVGWLAVF